MGFPTTAILDNFNRANQGPPPSTSWTSSGVVVSSNTLAANSAFATATWNTAYNFPLEEYITITTVPSNGGYIGIRFANDDLGNYIEILVNRNDTTGDTIVIQTLEEG